jgi:cardiolipin synthase A/B
MESTEGMGIPVKILQNNWAYRKEGISNSYRHTLKHAQSTIIIISSYFLPGRRIRNLLRRASARNVRVQLILQGASDVFLTKKASTWLYGWMLRNRFEIYEWEKTILHGKMTSIDNNWVTVGSYNVNHLSDYASIETNIETQDPSFCETVNKEIKEIIKNSTHITYSDYHHKMNPIQQFTCWLSFHIVRLLFKLQFALLAKE